MYNVRKKISYPMWDIITNFPVDMTINWNISVVRFGCDAGGLRDGVGVCYTEWSKRGTKRSYILTITGRWEELHWLP